MSELSSLSLALLSSLLPADGLYVLRYKMPVDDPAKSDNTHLVN